MKPLDHMFVLVAMFGCSPSTNATRIDGGPSADSSVGDTSEDDEIDDVPEDAPDANYKIFNPADYAGYDPTGATESSEAFQAAIDAASAYAASDGPDLYDPPQLEKADGTNVGPIGKQAIVRTDPNGVFKLNLVYLRSNVRIEIDASSTLIPIHTPQHVMLQGTQPSSMGGVTSQTYITNLTITSHGSSATFADTGRRCDSASLPSPCNLPKQVRYADMRFPDGKGWATGDETDLARRFVVDLDYRRYPDSTPPQETGDGPRGTGVKLRQVKNFLVEHMLELAFPGVVLDPNDNPSGPGGIGSNTYPATAGNGFAMEASLTPEGGQPNQTETAVQPRNGTIRYMHCEGCTRGYGILEIHAGVDIELEYISNRGGISVRWESGGNGRSTRQTARQVVGYDCNVPVLMSAHNNQQERLEAYDVKAIGCDAGFRSATTGGDTKNSSITKLDVYNANAEDSGGNAQVILCRFATCDTRYGSDRYDDDAWNFDPAQIAVYNDNSRPTSDITISQVRCTPPGTFAKSNVGYPACSGL
jgi:hypothetical protein